MKKITRRNFLKAAGIATLSSVVAGCNKESGSTTNTSSSASSGASQDGANGNFNPTGLPIVNEKETFHIVAYQAPNCLKPVAEKYIFQKLAEETNVEIIFEEVAATAWEEKINLMVSTGDLPDAVIGSDKMPNFGSAIEAELVVAWDDYIDILPALQATYEKYPTVEKATTYEGDGKHYYFPSINDKDFAFCRAPLFINETWLDAVGKEIPKTTDDLYDVLQAFKDGDPNNNGQHDEIPFCCAQEFFGPSFLDMLGAWDMMGIKNPFNTTVRNGKLDYNPVNENYRQALEFFHTLYADGLMDKEALTLPTATKVAQTTQDPAIFGFAQEWDINTYGTTKDQYTIMEPLIGPNGAQKATFNDTLLPSYAMVIFSTCKHPEVLMRYVDQANTGINALYSFYGEEGVLFEVNEEEKTYRVKFTELAEAGKGLENERMSEGMQNGWSVRGICGYAEVEDPQSTYRQKQEWTDLYTPYFFEEYFPAARPIAKANAESKQIALLETELITHVDAFMADAIMNGIDDAKWEKHLSQCKALQYETVLEYYQKAYDAMKA